MMIMIMRDIAYFTFLLLISTFASTGDSFTIGISFIMEEDNISPHILVI